MGGVAQRIGRPSRRLGPMFFVANVITIIIIIAIFLATIITMISTTTSAMAHQA